MKYFFKRLVAALFQINLQEESSHERLVQISADDVKGKSYPEALSTLYHGIE